MAMPIWSFIASGVLPITATSQRLTNSEATEPTLGLRPAAIRRSTPRRYASAAAIYCSRENKSVTLMGTPAKIASSMAGRPSGVPGILMKRLGRPARACRSLASASVVLVSCASNGETSSDTQPSTPLVRSWMGRNRSAALVMSSMASSKNKSSPDFPCASFSRIAGIVVRAALDGLVEDRRIGCQPCNGEFVRYNCEGCRWSIVCG